MGRRLRAEGLVPWSARARLSQAVPGLGTRQEQESELKEAAMPTRMPVAAHPHTLVPMCGTGLKAMASNLKGAETALRLPGGLELGPMRAEVGLMAARRSSMPWSSAKVRRRSCSPVHACCTMRLSSFFCPRRKFITIIITLRTRARGEGGVSDQRQRPSRGPARARALYREPRARAYQLDTSGRCMCMEPASSLARCASEPAPRSVERKVVTEALSLRCSTTCGSDASMAAATGLLVGSAFEANGKAATYYERDG
jgi:hypothetical protein